MLETFFDKEKTCRACTKTDNVLTSIFAQQNRPEEVCFSHMITECTMFSVPVDDELPHLICSECKDKVRVAYGFKKQYEESQKMLLTILQEMKKTLLVTNDVCNNSEVENSPEVVQESNNNRKPNFTRNTTPKMLPLKKLDEIVANSELLKEHVKAEAETSKHACTICSKEFVRLGYLTRHMNKAHKKEDIPKQNTNGEVSPAENTTIQDVFVKTETNLVMAVSSKSDSETEGFDFDFCTDNEGDTAYISQADALNTVKVEPEALESKTSFNDPAMKEEKQESEENPESIVDKQTQDAHHLCLLDSSRRFHCDECHKAFKRKSHLKQHSLCHTKVKPYQCTICQKKFGRPDNLKVHMSNHGQKQFQCNSCDRSFGQAYLLKRHKDQTHSEDKPFLCSICGQTFVRNGDLAVHIRRHTGEKPYKCQYCNKGFTRSTEVYVHERYHTGEKRHVCSICGKAFQRPYNLLVHVRTHTGERPYQCPHCPKNFAQCSDLKAHIRRHTGERYRCEQCGMGFIHVFVLNQHKLSVHGIEVQSRIKRVVKLSKDAE